jgi:uncharacterized protein (DUF934 family)
MPLVKSGKVVEDRFLRVADGEQVPEQGPVIVSADRFLADADEFAQRQDAVGVIWPNNRNVAELEPHLAHLAVIALVFPAYKDGRAYSQARVLRERYGFRGELRATGQVLRDQFVFMIRAGFDAFEVAKSADAAAFEEAARRYSVFFQPTGDGRMTVARVRTGRAAHPVGVRVERIPA